MAERRAKTMREVLERFAQGDAKREFADDAIAVGESVGRSPEPGKGTGMWVKGLILSGVDRETGLPNGQTMMAYSVVCGEDGCSANNNNNDAMFPTMTAAQEFMSFHVKVRHGGTGEPVGMERHPVPGQSTKQN